VTVPKASSVTVTVADAFDGGRVETGRQGSKANIHDGNETLCAGARVSVIEVIKLGVLCPEGNVGLGHGNWYRKEECGGRSAVTVTEWEASVHGRGRQMKSHAPASESA